MAYYASFLGDFLTATPEDSDEYDTLKVSAGAAAATNSQIQHHDLNSLDRILGIEQRLKGHFETLVAPGRRFVREGRLRLLRIGDKQLETPIDCLMIVFSDMLLIAKIAKHDKFKVLDRLPLDDVTVAMVCCCPAPLKEFECSLLIDWLVAWLAGVFVRGVGYGPVGRRGRL